jgi:sigma-B regulation protein RsbU (phosphoserine phosphatase)
MNDSSRKWALLKIPRARLLLFALFAVFFLLIQGLYLAEMIHWRFAPDRGWRSSTELGYQFVASLSPPGQSAGLKIGDEILSVNNRTFKTYHELREVTDWGVGRTNIYEINRNGSTIEINVTNGKLGLRRVAMQSGTYWTLGTLFLIVGILVFLMKPDTETSWVFSLMAALLGVFITFSAPSAPLRVNLLYNVRILAPSFLAGSILHLSLVFPRRWELPRKKLVMFALFLFSLVIAVVVRSSAYGDPLRVPTNLWNIVNIYMFFSLLVFTGLILLGFFKAPSTAVRLQSLVILTGIVIALLVPMLDVMANVFLNILLFPNPMLFYMTFLMFFPLSIGYAIVKHDLFDIDVLVRRTYGYVLSTATVVGAYALVVSLLNTIFQNRDLSRSPVFSLLFALTVVFTFRPLHERIQAFVNRLFHRQRYDYRKTIMAISEALITILDPSVVQKTLIGSAVREMVLENGLLLLPGPDTESYRLRVSEGEIAGSPEDREIKTDGQLIQVLAERKKALFRHDVELDPAYEQDRQTLTDLFDDFDSEMFTTLTYKDELRGIVSLGRKKSGKMFTGEDLDLLRTLLNQGAVALENARLFEENIEKGRMEEELKIAHDLQNSMLPAEPPDVPGFEIAARSISAQEVGGDFYDFLETQSEERDGKVGFVIADVSGKAVSGALVMSATRSIFRMLSGAELPVHEVMKRSNKRLKGDVTKGMFVALLYAILDSGSRTLTYSNAGQTQPILCPGDGSPPVFLDTGGDRFPLGVLDESDYRESVVELSPGDLMVFYTDGVVEAMNEDGEMYGFERLTGKLDDLRSLSPDEFLDRLMSDVSDFVGNAVQHDDITVVVVGVK